MEIKVVGKTGDSMWHYPLTSIMVVMDNKDFEQLNSSYNRLVEEKVANGFDCVDVIGDILKAFKNSEDLS